MSFSDSNFTDSYSCTHVPLSANTLLAAYQQNATSNVIVIDIETETWRNLGFPFVGVERLAKVSDTSFTVIGTTRDKPTALYQVDTADFTSHKILKSSADLDIPDSLYSAAEHISFPRVVGDYTDGSAYAIFSPPHNPEYRAQSGALPPLVLELHGGPTYHINPGLSTTTQYWTSRGYAYVSVNYAGSTGYGRAYRDLLNGKWGILDVADAVSCATHLSAISKVDASRVGICGQSAGGYGVLQALCDHPKIWAGGISLFGISSLKALLKDMHKFESHLLDRLLFKDGTSADEKEQILHDRSPLFHAGNITSPVLLLQGTADPVVPPNQTKEMEKKILESGGKVRVVMFEGEGHGFIQKQNIKKTLEEEELWFRTTLVEK